MWIAQYEGTRSTTHCQFDQWWTVRTVTHKLHILFHFALFTLLIHTGESTQIVHFEMEEERPIGFLVGLLIKQLPDTILTGPGRLTFRTIQEGHADLFTLGPSDGRIKVASRIDREVLCPNPDESANNGNVGPECQLTFSVNLLRLTATGTDIVDILRIVIMLHDIDDNVCFYTPSHHQVVQLPENVSPDQLPHIPLHSLCDLDTGPGNGIEKTSIRLRVLADDIDLNEKPAFDLEINETSLATKPFTLFLVPKRAFDYEKVNRYEIFVEAGGRKQTDNGTCRLKVTVHISDQNDFAPRFTQNYSVIKIPETAGFNVPIYTLSAFDSDLGPLYSRLIYEFDVHASPSVLSRFRVDRHNGSIFIRAPLNYRLQALYDIPLVVRNPLPNEDEHSPAKLGEILMNPIQSKFIDRALIQVHVLDVNDRPPTISVFTPDGGDLITVMEHIKDIPVDVAVVSVIDEDTGIAGAINCSLDAKQQNIFALTPISQTDRHSSIGLANDTSERQPFEVIYKLSALVPFDRETADYVDVTIHCHDAGSPPLQTEHIVHIRVDDVNDHAPILNQTKMRFAVNEDSDPLRKHIGHRVGQVQATDPDIGVNARLAFELTAESSDRNYFTIDNKTGVIRSLGNLDREKQTQHQLVVNVRDSGVPRRSTSGTVDIIVLDYNDEAPVFERQAYEFHIVENNNLGELVGSLRATDADVGTNAIVHFHIEPMNQYMYSVNAPESMSTKTDLHSKLPFDLVSYFDTVHNAYEIRIYANEVIDREMVNIPEETGSGRFLRLRDVPPSQKTSTHSPCYKFWIVGEDAGTPKRRGQTLVHVFVDDVNDEYPVFHSPEANFTVIGLSYLEKVGHAIWQMLAIDRDAGTNGTVKYRLDQIRFHNYTKTRSAAVSYQSPIRQPGQFFLTDLFNLHPATGVLRLGQPLIAADVGSLFAVSVVAEDMGAPHVMQTAVTFFVQVHDSAPVGDPMDDAGDFSLDVSNTYSYNSPEDGSSLNFYIIISIVFVSFMISAILISGICIALRKRKSSVPRAAENANGGTNIPLSEYPAAEKTPDVVVSKEYSYNGSFHDPFVEQLSSANPKLHQSPLITSTSKPKVDTLNRTSSPVADSLLAYNTQLMQLVDFPTGQSPSSPSDMKTVHLVCSEHGTMQRLVGSTYDANDLRPRTSDAIFICTSDNAGNLYPATMHSPLTTESYKSSSYVTADLSSSMQQPVTLIDYSHPMEVQHLCVHPHQLSSCKRNSLGSTDQDSGNGDSLNIPSAPIVAVNKSIWLPTPLAISRTSPPVHSLTLPLVHVYTPLSCVTETESGSNSVVLPN